MEVLLFMAAIPQFILDGTLVLEFVNTVAHFRLMRLLRRSSPCNDSLGACHCERSEAISLGQEIRRRTDGKQ